MIRTNIQIANERARAVYEAPGVPPLLKQIAQVHGITIREFARLFSMSKSHAEDILNHKRFPSMVEGIRIARYFEISVEDLFAWRIDDNGDRRPLLIQDPRTKKVLRLSRNADIREARALACLRSKG